MSNCLPPLPYGFAWRPKAGGGGELTIWGVEAVATVEPGRGAWLSRVNICFHPSLHRDALAGSKRQACYWVHRWVKARAESIYRARPEACAVLGHCGAAGTQRPRCTTPDPR